MHPSSAVRRLLAQLFLLGISSAILSGCGGGARPAVEGEVTLDGLKVDHGSIEFIPEDRTNAPAGTAIVDGKYEIDNTRGPVPGTYRVAIRWDKKTGRQIPTPGDNTVMTDESKQIVAEAKEKVEIKAGGNKLNFDLKSK
jgi:hypothetical protein